MTLLFYQNFNHFLSFIHFSTTLLIFDIHFFIVNLALPIFNNIHPSILIETLVKLKLEHLSIIISVYY